MSDRPSAHFSWREVECKCGNCKLPGAVRQEALRLASALEASVRKLGPVYVNSWYRCAEHNEDVGGAKSSQHTRGTAADIEVDGVSGEFLAGYLEACIRAGLIPEGGVGLYAEYPDMVHYDIRGRRARWVR